VEEERSSDAPGRLLRRALRTLVLGLAVLLVNPTACTDAPGCGGGCGGCTNKQAMRDFRYSGPSCLAVGTNDCTWNTLEFHNDCSTPAVFGDSEIPAGHGYDYRRPMRRPDGGYDLCPAGNECTGTNPSDETVVLDGTVDGEPVHISFFVTGEQC
jgi:hypothetical protein